MTTTDWILDITLIAIVLRQLREGRLDARFFLIPLGLVSWAAVHFVKTVPTAGNDLVLIGALIVAGATLGFASGAATHVRVADGHALVRASATAATLWVLGTGSRLAFQLYATHGGAAAITRFSVKHDITSQDAYVTGLILMALAEVVVRMGVIGIRGHRALRAAAAPTAGHRPLVGCSL